MKAQEVYEEFRELCHHRKVEFVTAVPVGNSVMLLARGENAIKTMREFAESNNLEYTEPALMLEALGTYVTPVDDD